MCYNILFISLVSNESSQKNLWVPRNWGVSNKTSPSNTFLIQINTILVFHSSNYVFNYAKSTYCYLAPRQRKNMRLIQAEKLPCTFNRNMRDCAEVCGNDISMFTIDIVTTQKKNKFSLFLHKNAQFSTNFYHVKWLFLKTEVAVCTKLYCTNLLYL